MESIQRKKSWPLAYKKQKENRRKGLAMASAKEIKKHLKIALKEIGEIKPFFNKVYKSWIFSHPSYPDVEYAGESKDEVIKNYPLYLKDFIEEMLNNNLAPHIEKAVKGRGGKRAGAGRPKGRRLLKRRIYVPQEIAEDVVEFFHQPNSIKTFRQLIAKSH
ncbi:MAG: hypothetical protein HZB76_01035 [Chlamydiae bacterium]|nr:hypothetical protein [Chlamydiota bacterium]